MEQTTQQTTEQQTPSPISDELSLPSVSSASEVDAATLLTENEALKTELRLLTAREHLMAALTSERARSPELLFQSCRDLLEFDDGGLVKNAADLIAELKQRFPEQFIVDAPQPPKPPPLAAPINAGAGRLGSRPPLTKEMLAEMQPREIADLPWSDVKQILAN